MKIRNKKTGEILKLGHFLIENPNRVNCENITKYNTLAELYEEWEDYEEPKSYWSIDCLSPDGIVSEFTGSSRDVFMNRKSIGNYFETKEEAEKAVEKLKAWKRLRDNGFKFEGLEKRGRWINFYKGKSYETDRQCQQAMQDLDLLFGGENE